MKDQGKETVISDKEKEEKDSSQTEELDKAETDQEENLTSDTPTENDDEKNELQTEIDRLNEEVEQLNDRLLRNQAEFENFKRRTQKEKAAERKYKSEELATEILPVLDNFERALQSEVSEENKSFMEGMQMVYSQLQTALESQGIEQIETTDQPFDPNFHHAVMQIEDEELDSNIVVEELQKGYMLKDKVIRPAMVKVNK